MSALRAARHLAPLLVVLAAFLAPPIASAHDSDATIDLDPATIAPGGGVLVTGHGLEREVDVRVSLDGVDSGIVIGTERVDRAGHFQRVIAVPGTLPAGVYGVKVELGDQLLASNVLVVDPAAGQGHPVDTGPSGVLVVIGAAVAATALVVALRIRRSPRPSPRPS